MSRVCIETYNQLEAFLRNWDSFGGGPEYDFVGIVALLAACLDNLQTNALEAELEDVGGCFNDRQKVMLKKLASYV